MGQIYRVSGRLTQGNEVAAYFRYDKVRSNVLAAACLLSLIVSHHNFVAMRTSLVVTLLMCGLFGHQALAQDKVAEGEYEGRVSNERTLSERTRSRWILQTTRSGRYLLRSEIIGPPDLQGKFVQVEELNEKLVPMAIGYEVYLKNQKQAFATMKCDFAADSIMCRGHSEKDIEGAKGTFVCKSHKHVGPFWFWVENFFVFDFPWLTSGAVNMANLKNGKIPLSVVTFEGGRGEDCVSAEEDGVLEFVAAESLEVGGTKVAVKHYSLKSGNSKPFELWTTEAGVLIKLSDADEGLDFVLANYKQYRKLIPELPVETRSAEKQNAK